MECEIKYAVVVQEKKSTAQNATDISVLQCHTCGANSGADFMALLPSGAAKKTWV